MRKISTVLMLIAAFLLPACNKHKGIRIAVIPKGTSHVFWKTVEAGAKKAGEDLHVEVIWMGPQREDEKSQQIDIVTQFIHDGVSGICLAPTDSTALVSAVQEAGNKSIPVVIFDSALEGQAGKDFISFVASDNLEGGRMAAREMARLLHHHGKIVVFRYKEGHASTGERERGFIEEIEKLQKDHPELQIIEREKYAGATAGEAQKNAALLSEDLRHAEGIFCPNESSTQGMLSFLQEKGWAGSKKFVGFDTSDSLLDGLRKGEISALVAQDPFTMGYQAVATMVKKLKGEAFEAHVPTALKLVTKENLDSEEIKKLTSH